MRKGIIVVTHENNKDTWLPECLEALKDVEVDVYTNTNENNHYEGGGILYGYDKYDEFWIIPDTVIVKDTKKLMEWLNDDGVSYSAGPWYISCIAKLRKETLDKAGLFNAPTTKMEAINVEVGYLRLVYEAAETNHVTIDEKFIDSDKFEEKHGRTNMILENEYFKKYKGTWSPDMVRQ